MAYRNAWILLSASFLIAISACSDESEGTYRKLGERTFTHINGKAAKKLILPIGELIVVGRVPLFGGRARGLTPLGVAPHAKVYVVDLKKMKTLLAYATSRGPCDAEFSEKLRKILTDEVLINFNSGRVIEKVSPDDLRFERESCEEFQGKRLLQ